MICHQCQSNAKEGSRFCTYCGIRFPRSQDPSQASHEIDIGLVIRVIDAMDTLVIDEAQFVEITDLFSDLLDRVGVPTGRSSQDVKTLVNNDIQEVAQAVMGRLGEARRHFHKTLGPPDLF